MYDLYTLSLLKCRNGKGYIGETARIRTQATMHLHVQTYSLNNVTEAYVSI